MNTRFSIKIAGESGQGVNSTGEILAKSLKDSGFHVFGYREYPSLINGGNSMYQVEFSDMPIHSPQSQTDILLCLSRKSVSYYASTLKDNGLIIHGIQSLTLEDSIQKSLDQNKISTKHVNISEIVKTLNLVKIFPNVLMLGYIWAVLDLDISIIENRMKEEFADKTEILDVDIKSIRAGYKLAQEENKQINSNIKPYENHWNKSLLISGNESLALGAVSAGVRAYFGYPMTPSTTILSTLSDFQKSTGMLIKQAEDEITAAQMTIGAMFAGTRALTASSGGGFDLMTESLSLSGITETPFVCVIAQRPGPATGLPTWTAQGDLNLALNSGHGEFPRCVVSVSDIESCYIRIQEAFNLAETLQIPVLILTDKLLAESIFNISNLPSPIRIERGLLNDIEIQEVESKDRFAFTNSGVSKRWLPGQSDATYLANSDEHDPAGNISEEAENAKLMMEKRMKKINQIFLRIPEPALYGSHNAQITFVGWGSTKNVVCDVIDYFESTGSNNKVNYLHYDYIYPLKTNILTSILNGQPNIVLIENNYDGQLGNLITKETGFKFRNKFLKYDGRPFYFDEVIDFVKNFTF